jgi:hypothetical protein
VEERAAGAGPERADIFAWPRARGFGGRSAGRELHGGPAGGEIASGHPPRPSNLTDRRRDRIVVAGRRSPARTAARQPGSISSCPSPEPQSQKQSKCDDVSAGRTGAVRAKEHGNSASQITSAMMVA